MNEHDNRNYRTLNAGNMKVDISEITNIIDTMMDKKRNFGRDVLYPNIQEAMKQTQQEKNDNKK